MREESEEPLLDYQKLAQQMLQQWQKDSAEFMRQPAFMKAMMDAMQPNAETAGASSTGASSMNIVQQMQRNMKSFYEPDSHLGGTHERQSPAHPAADDAVDADELAWVKQRLAACEARIAMLEAKVD